MANIKPPKPLLVNNDIEMAVEWSDWLDEYENYFIAAKIKNERAEVQVANFQTALGRDANKILRSLGLSTEQLKALKKIQEALTQHFAPPKNKTYERYQFHRLKQQPNETFQDFLHKLIEQVKHCAYGNNTEEFVMDQIVLGINSEKTRQKLWVEENLTLENEKIICRAAKRAGRQIAELNHELDNTNVNAIKMSESKFKCRRCGTMHGSRSCPAFNKECNGYGRLGHGNVQIKKH
ncbi:PREDICTED: uncharacterized protein LOC108377395 [Rhagoletis zephyria]|uniref:uncharacterized protein LOC108377395 n=1 Tax=Rhagoletis zephyria TaxID=28612 RepID=UPI000811524F|nr:PREDICTED: uncharacterized protein LOC108377395 [Rhagoletis zephyria]